jgi:3-hydroxyacyl-CoA dehydrogenase
MTEPVKLSNQGEIAVISIDNPPVNALSPGVPEGIAACIDKVRSDGSIKAAVLIGEGRTFIAGADINEFPKMISGERDRDVALHPYLFKIEDCNKPVVAAIHGTAFGGGLETAMSCHYRVAVASAQVGQPEVKLGLIPGAGGTQRLPRLVGPAAAVMMCASGDPIPATKARDLGLIDAIVEGDLLEGAVAFARELLASGEGPRRTRELNDKLGEAEANAPIFAAARAEAEKKARGAIAPLRAIDAVEAATRLSFTEGINRETEFFQECLFSPQSQGLIHTFFGERAVAKIPGLSKDARVAEIARAAVVGAGVMGGGIAMVYANAGIPVLLKEAKQELLDRGMETIRKNYARTVSKGKLAQEKMDRCLSLIEPTLTYDKFGEVDIVVEAVFEDMGVKKSVFAELDRVARPEAILASNTSTLDIDAIASATSRPERVVGHHFFSPANVMRLLEIVRGKQTAHDVIATSMALAKKLKKVGVLAGNAYGFIGNRMLEPYLREAEFLVEEGARPMQVDDALTDFGMAMGPLAMLDLSGLDVSWRIRRIGEARRPEGARACKILDRLYELGRHGQKNGKGWYLYAEGDRAPKSDPEVDAVIEKCSAEAAIERRAIQNKEIVQRTIYALINEGAKALEEGIALRAVDIDIVYIYGYGFPAHRGGPMFHADRVGLQKILTRMTEFAKRDPIWWKPAPLLQQLGEADRSFADWEKERAKA